MTGRSMINGVRAENARKNKGGRRAPSALSPAHTALLAGGIDYWHATVNDRQRTNAAAAAAAPSNDSLLRAKAMRDAVFQKGLPPPAARTRFIIVRPRRRLHYYVANRTRTQHRVLNPTCLFR